MINWGPDYEATPGRRERTDGGAAQGRGVAHRRRASAFAAPGIDLLAADRR